MKVALVYDRVNKWGGAERVLLALHMLFPDAPLYTSLYSPKKAEWADVFEVRPSFLQESPVAQISHEYLASIMPLAFESFDFDEFDLVVSITSEAAKGIITKPHTKHISYCLTPTRYLWSGYDDYFKSDVFKLISRPLVKHLRDWDKVAAARPDKFISISKEVKARVRKFYDRESDIVYPPVMITPKRISAKSEGYYLVVSRLTNFYKRIDIVIEACNRLRLPLKIIGTGRDEAWLKSISGPTVEFLGDVSEDELSNCYSKCKALIFPAREDFGLSMAEALSFGKPVIAFRGGGSLEIVRKGQTGEFFKEQTPESLMSVLENFRVSSYNTLLCTKSAQKFSFENFKKGFLKEISNL